MLTFVFLILALLVLGGLVVTVMQNAPRWTTGLAGFLFLVMIAGAMGNTSVDAGSVGIQKRFGRVVGQLDPGLHFIRPIGDSVDSFPVQSRIVKPNEDASSADLQVVHFEVTFRYHIDPNHAAYVFVQDNGDPESKVITPAILEAIKATTSLYNVQELISERQAVRDKIASLVAASLNGTYVIPESVAITDFKFSQEYENAIEQKQVAEQTAEKEKNVLQQKRVQADQKKVDADGDAQATMIRAGAQAKAQEMLRQSLTPELLQQQTLDLLRSKWNGQFPDTYIGGGGLNPANILLAPRKN